MAETKVNIDFKDVWSAVKDVASEISDEGTLSVAQNAFVLPKGINSPDQLTGWNGDYSNMQVKTGWTSQWFLILTTPTRVRLGALWYYGGNVDGKGQYIANADIYFLVDSIGRWEKFKVSGTFDAPFASNTGVAQLGGQIEFGYYEYSELSARKRVQFMLRGDGYGRMDWI